MLEAIPFVVLATIIVLIRPTLLEALLGIILGVFVALILGWL
jgi:hypothetical protein